MFLQKLFDFDPSLLSRQIFSYRCSKILKDNSLVLFLTSLKSSFFFNIVKILEKYELLPYLMNYDCSGLFPHKSSWMKMVKSKIAQRENDIKTARMQNANDFIRFRYLYSEGKPSVIWTYANTWSHDVRRNASLSYGVKFHK
jgi:hypothetical protein